MDGFVLVAQLGSSSGPRTLAGRDRAGLAPPRTGFPLYGSGADRLRFWPPSDIPAPSGRPISIHATAPIPGSQKHRLSHDAFGILRVTTLSVAAMSTKAQTHNIAIRKSPPPAGTITASIRIPFDLFFPVSANGCPKLKFPRQNHQEPREESAEKRDPVV